MLETSRNINQWFANAAKFCGGKWYYQGKQGSRAHQLMARLCTVETQHGEDASLLWLDDPITKRDLEKLWKNAQVGAIIAGNGYGVLEDNSVSRAVASFAEKHGISHHHNRSHPAVWWIVKEQSDESAPAPTDKTVDIDVESDSSPGSAFPGSE